MIIFTNQTNYNVVSFDVMKEDGLKLKTIMNNCEHNKQGTDKVLNNKPISSKKGKIVKQNILDFLCHAHIYI